MDVKSYDIKNGIIVPKGRGYFVVEQTIPRDSTTDFPNHKGEVTKPKKLVLSWEEDQLQISYGLCPTYLFFTETTDSRLIDVRGQRSSKFGINHLFRKALEWSQDLRQLIKTNPERYGLTKAHAELLDQISFTIESRTVPALIEDTLENKILKNLRGPIRFIPHIALSSYNGGELPELKHITNPY
jgi:hypothetical protein